MNNTRRKSIAAVISQLEFLRNEIENLHEEELEQVKIPTTK